MSLVTLESALRVSVILLVALIACVLTRTRPAALRHWVLAVAVACAWATPLLSGVLPSWLSTPFLSASADGATPTQPKTSSPPVEAASTGSARVQSEFAFVTGLRAPHDGPTGAEIAWGVWLLGSALSGLILLAGLARLWWLASRARPIETGPWRELGEELRRAYGIASPIRLLEGNHAYLLITWGSRRPKVLLPAAARGWSPDCIRIVLTHELAHVARGDWAAQLAAEALRAVYWFNPLLWIACRRLRMESERACDDAVLALGIEGPEYAGHLLALARSLHPRRQSWLPAPAMARPSSLEGRIRAMLDTTLNRRPLSRPARLGIVAALLALSISVAGVRAQSQFYSLAGTVVDPTSRVLPNATLVLTNTVSNAKHEVRSDGGGRFEFVGLPPGTYSLTVSSPGFNSLNETISVTGSVERELRLRVGTLQETITISSRSEAAVPDAAAAERRAQARRRFAEIQEREKARCADGGAASPVGGRILPPAKLLDVRPVYPDHLRAAGIGGTVTMEAVIGTDGLVSEVKNVTGPHPELEASAADAVRQWQFSTTLLNCEPIEVGMKVTTNFAARP
jgi:TonB family protein